MQPVYKQSIALMHQIGTAYSAFERGSILGAGLSKSRELAMRLFASVEARHGQPLSACHQVIRLHVPSLSSTAYCLHREVYMQRTLVIEQSSQAVAKANSSNSLLDLSVMCRTSQI